MKITKIRQFIKALEESKEKVRTEDLSDILYIYVEKQGRDENRGIMLAPLVELDDGNPIIEIRIDVDDDLAEILEDEEPLLVRDKREKQAIKKYFVEITKGEYNSEILGHGHIGQVRHPQILMPSGNIISVSIDRESEKSDMKKYSMTEKQINAIDAKFMQFATEV